MAEQKEIVEDKGKKIKKETFHYAKEIIKTIFLIAFIFVFFRYYVIQPFLVVGDSMEPTFQDSEYILVNEFSYLFTAPKRGDVIVFKHPDKECTKFVDSSYINRKFLQGPCKNFIKRIVALPGETIEIKEGNVKIFNSKNPEGLFLKEDYVGGLRLFGNQKVTLAENEYYVLGDNREPNGSSDSREWGPLPRKYITGKAAVIVLPPSEAGIVTTPKY